MYRFVREILLLSAYYAARFCYVRNRLNSVEELMSNVKKVID